MSSNFTYPGVYMQEIPSTVHTIVPVPTAVAAFVGRAVRGPINTPVRIHSYADFERVFGGLWSQSEMAYAVQQYFLNGGSDAYIVRAISQGIVSAQSSSPASIGVSTSAGALYIAAQNPGAWFANVIVSIDLNTRKVAGSRKPDEFNLTMTYREIDPVTGAASVTVETFPNLSYLAGATNYIATTLQNDSAFIAIQAGGTVPQAQPTPGNYTIAGAVWLPNTAFVAGSVIYDTNGNEQVVTTSGLSGRTSPDWKEAVGGITGDDGVTWANQGSVRLSAWQPNTAYVLNQVIYDGSHLQIVTVAGTSAKTTPGWRAQSGQQITHDGGVTWNNIGPVQAGIWEPSTVVVVGTSLYDPNGNLQVVTTPGVTDGDGPPNKWTPTPGGTTGDATVVWTNQGQIPVALWQPNTFYPDGVVVYDSNANLQKATTGGTTGIISGSTPPAAWGDAPSATTDDNTVVWTFQNATGLSDGSPLVATDLTDQSLEVSKNGIYALKDAEIFTMLILPPYGPQENGGTIDLDSTYSTIWPDALAFCDAQRAMLLVDPISPLAGWPNEMMVYQDLSGATPAIDNVRDPNSVLYYPWIQCNDPLINNRPRNFAPSATVAGVMARIDGTRGVWKSPAGEEANILGVTALQYLLTNEENGDLNPLGINCLRTFPIIGSVVWGARTLDGADAQASQWKYVAVRRLALFIETSLYRGTNWAVFEPNDTPLWSELRLNVGSFMRNLFRQGAFQGSTQQQAYFVQCDSSTTTQTDIDNGVVNILVGFAPLKPAEFVVIKISQITSDSSN